MSELAPVVQDRIDLGLASFSGDAPSPFATPANLQVFRPDELRLLNGELLRQPQVGYQTWGELNAAGDNVIWVCHALTGTSDVESWWPGLWGPGKPLDPTRFFIVCANVLGGCYGSAGPLSHGGGEFPTLTIADLVAHQRLLAEHLGVRRFKLLIGGSMGGFQVLEWALQVPEKIDAIALIATADSQPAQAIALSDLQIKQIQLDPKFNHGRYQLNDPPIQGLALARQIGHLSYRSDAELSLRFGRTQRQDGVFQVLSYLQHQGDKLVKRFDANCYVRLNQAMLSFSIHNHPDAAKKLKVLSAKVLIVGVDSDALYSWREQQKLATYFKDAKLVQIASLYGHDAFLLEADQYAAEVADLLRDYQKPKLTQKLDSALVRSTSQPHTGTEIDKQLEAA